MAASKVTFPVKVLGAALPDVAENKKITFGNVNELKTVTDNHADLIDVAETSLSEHVADVSNPHNVTQAQVGLSEVDNTSDANKPVSTATALAISTAINNLLNGAPGALDTLEELAAAMGDDPNFAATVTNALTTLQSSLNSHTANTTNPHNVTKAQVGLGSADDTADIAKPVSTAQQTALNLKQDSAYSSVLITGAVTLTGSAFGVIHYLSGTTADYTVGLPTAVGNAGKAILFKALSGLTKIVTIDANSTETINGLLVRALSSNGAFTVISNGTNWEVVNEIASIIPFVPTAVGVIALTTPTCWYSLLGKRLTLNYSTGASTSNGTTYTLSLPSGMVSNSRAEIMVRIQNNSAILATPGVVDVGVGSTSAVCYTSPGGGAWLATGTRFCNFQITIEIQ